MTVLSCLMATVTAHGHQRITGFLFSPQTSILPFKETQALRALFFLFFTILSIKLKCINTHTLLNSISLLFHSYISPHPSWMFLFPTFFFLYLWTEKLPNSSHGPQPCLTQWNYEPCHVGPPKTDGSWWSVMTKRGPLEKEMANHFSILALRTPWTVYEKAKRVHWKLNSPGE